MLAGVCQTSDVGHLGGHVVLFGLHASCHGSTCASMAVAEALQENQSPCGNLSWHCTARAGSTSRQTLPSSREGILEGRPWNKWLRHEVRLAGLHHCRSAVSAHFCNVWHTPKLASQLSWRFKLPAGAAHQSCGRCFLMPCALATMPHENVQALTHSPILLAAMLLPCSLHPPLLRKPSRPSTPSQLPRAPSAVQHCCSSCHCLERCWTLS